MISYAFIVTVYALLIGSLLGLAVLSHRPGGRVPTLGRLVASLRSARAGRIFLVLVWWWVGWHVYVR